MRERLRTWRAVLGALAAGFAMLAVIGAAYRFHDVGAELNDIGWRSAPFLRLHALVPHLRLPVARRLRDRVRRPGRGRGQGLPVVLLNRWYPRGVWYYFLVMWLLKEPVLLLAAQVYGLGRARWPRARSGPTPRWPSWPRTSGSASPTSRSSSRRRWASGSCCMCVPMLALIAGARGWRRWWRPRAGGRRSSSSPWPRSRRTCLISATISPSRTPPSGPSARPTASSPTRTSIGDRTTTRSRAGLDERGLRGAAFNPYHALPGENVFDLNYLAGVGRFRQHQWLREHASPARTWATRTCGLRSTPPPTSACSTRAAISGRRP